MPLLALPVLALPTLALAEPFTTRFRVTDLSWPDPPGTALVILDLPGVGKRPVHIDPAEDPHLAAPAPGDVVTIEIADVGWRIVAREGSTVGCQAPATWEVEGYARLGEDPLLRRIHPPTRSRRSLAVGGLLDPQQSCPPAGTRIAVDLPEGATVDVRWNGDGWEPVPAR